MEIFSSVYAHAVAASALAVVAVQQILKLKFIPLEFANKYPVPTSIGLSVVAAIIAASKGYVRPVTWVDWAILASTILVTAALTYRTTLRSWTELRETEG